MFSDHHFGCSVSLAVQGSKGGRHSHAGLFQSVRIACCKGNSKKNLKKSELGRQN